jgi:outer membrane lipoprotein-sorting protein
MRWTLFFFSFLLLIPRMATALTVDELLTMLDKNLTFDTRESTISMTVTRADRVKSYKMHSWSRGQTDAAVEYEEPVRDKGTRMLRLGDDMWMYMPSTEKVQKISGHMLRQSMMGSDMSYEDMMEASSWKERYTGVLEGNESYDGHNCYKLKLTAKSADVSYPTRIVWIDQTSNIPLKQELYALSGQLLKTWTMGDVKLVEGRQWPSKMSIEDKLQQGSRTDMTFDSVDFSVSLEAEIFSTRWLER